MERQKDNLFPSSNIMRGTVMGGEIISTIFWGFTPACDGAAVMLGCKSGSKKLLPEEIPSIAVVWHGADHRLELFVGDTVKEISGTNRFKLFIDKLYVQYHASPKNCIDLHLCAELCAGVELLKIGRIVSSRWVSSSFRSVLAVWNNFDSLAYHFEDTVQDSTRDVRTAIQLIFSNEGIQGNSTVIC